MKLRIVDTIQGVQKCYFIAPIINELRLEMLMQAWAGGAWHFHYFLTRYCLRNSVRDTRAMQRCNPVTVAE